MAKAEMWRDYARQVQVIADLRAELRESEARVGQLLELCDQQDALHKKLCVQFDRLMASHQACIAQMKADAASVADWITMVVAAREAEEAANKVAEEKPAA